MVLDNFVSATARACYFHLRRSSQIRKSLTPEAATKLVVSLMLSWIDDCNSLLSGLPDSTIQTLQRVQNNAARLIPSPGLKVNVSKRFKNKNTNHRPTILFNFKDPVPLLQVSQQLCLRLPFLLTPPYFPPAIFALPPTLSACTSFTPNSLSLALRSFSAYGPHIWNTLPLSLRLNPFLSSFQSALKTYLYQHF